MAKKKAGQGMDEGRGMDIPAAALVGARKGLVYCLVGLISHRRYSSKVLHLARCRPQHVSQVAKPCQPVFSLYPSR